MWHDMEMNFNPGDGLFNNSDRLIGSVVGNQVHSHEYSKSLEHTIGKVICSEPLDIPRKSVICSVEDADLDGNRSDCEDSSCGSSMVMEGDTETAEDSAVILNEFEPQNEPAADPSQIECVLTDTSGDENSDCEEQAHLDGTNEFISSDHPRRTSCFMCTYVVIDGEDSRDLVKHLQSTHKFAVYKLKNMTVTKQEMKSEDNILMDPEMGFSCCKTRGGCGAVFISKQALLSHHVCSRTAGSPCWVSNV